jgi:diamine N-acetyltransferase
MTTILKELTKDNWRDCVRLKVLPEQENYIAPNSYSMAQVRFTPHFEDWAIYTDDLLVGYTMLGKDEDKENSYWVIRFMIDHHHQNKGHGRAAILAVLDYLKAKSDCQKIYISYVQGNLIAEKLYLDVGFVKTGEIDEGEEIAVIE